MDELMIYGEKPLTAAEIRAQVNLIQEVMKAVMQKSQHYGVIAGRTVLFKAGAEKILSTFRLAVDPVITDLSIPGIVRYRVTCRLLTQSDGRFVGAGVGECSSEEEKYQWRIAVSDDEWNNTPEDERKIKYKRDGKIKQVRVPSADVANTILKMAKKRALLDAVLTVTAASDLFTQDIEDMPEELIQQIEQEGLSKQRPVAAPKEVSPVQDRVSGIIREITHKPTRKGGKYYSVILDDGSVYHTFDDKKAEVAQKAWATGTPIEIQFTSDDQYGNKIQNVIILEPGSNG